MTIFSTEKNLVRENKNIAKHETGLGILVIAKQEGNLFFSLFFFVGSPRGGGGGGAIKQFSICCEYPTPLIETMHVQKQRKLAYPNEDYRMKQLVKILAFRLKIIDHEEPLMVFN